MPAILQILSGSFCFPCAAKTMGTRSGGLNILSVVQSGVFWSAVGAIATVFLTFAIFLTRHQIRLQSWLTAQEVFTNAAFTKIRGRIFAKLDEPTRSWTDDQRNDAMELCRRMDELAWLAPFVGKRLLMKVWGDPLARAWLILEPTVEQERAKTGNSSKWGAFERLGKKALQQRANVAWVQRYRAVCATVQTANTQGNPLAAG
jgi:hypothetical protein